MRASFLVRDAIRSNNFETSINACYRFLCNIFSFFFSPARKERHERKKFHRLSTRTSCLDYPYQSDAFRAELYAIEIWRQLNELFHFSTAFTVNRAALVLWQIGIIQRAVFTVIPLGPAVCVSQTSEWLRVMPDRFHTRSLPPPSD